MILGAVFLLPFLLGGSSMQLLDSHIEVGLFIPRSATDEEILVRMASDEILTPSVN